MSNVTYTSEHPESETRFAGIIESYLGSRADTMSLLDKLLADDPAMPMALVFRGCLLKLAADPRFKRPIDQCIEALRDSAMNNREAKHLEALAAWQSNRMLEAAACYDSIARDYPTDIVALRMAHYLYFYTTGGDNMVNSITQVFDAWTPETPGYGYLLGMLAFALEEQGHYDEAEAHGKAAVAINPADIWATHAVTHVFQMQDRFSEGLPFIKSLEQHWRGLNNFVNHMHWHHALQYIGAGQPGMALQLYDSLLTAPLKDDFTWMSATPHHCSGDWICWDWTPVIAGRPCTNCHDSASVMTNWCLPRCTT